VDTGVATTMDADGGKGREFTGRIAAMPFAGVC